METNEELIKRMRDESQAIKDMFGEGSATTDALDAGADALEAATTETEPIKTLTYAPNVRNGMHTGRPEGFTEQQWHQDAAADTGTSHNLAGRLYVVQCEWCPRAFAAQSKAGAVAMFRAHEAEMFEPLPVEGENNA